MIIAYVLRTINDETCYQLIFCWYVLGPKQRQGLAALKNFCYNKPIKRYISVCRMFKNILIDFRNTVETELNPVLSCQQLLGLFRGQTQRPHELVFRGV